MATRRGNASTVAGHLEQVSAQQEQDRIVEGEIEPPPTAAQRDANKIDEENADEILAALLQVEAADEVTWQVSRLLPAQEQGYLFDLSTAELKLAVIARRAGAGKYRVRGFRPNGQYAGGRT